MTKRGRLARKLFRLRRAIRRVAPTLSNETIRALVKVPADETMADCHKITKQWQPRIYQMDFTGYPKYRRRIER